MKKTMMTMAVALLTVVTASASERRISSPDGRMTVTVNDEGGRPTYQVSLDGQTYVQTSPLGVKANF
ncbi:MAG: glycoside hydrolase family 97 N-terminal domain-containing protein, partial [bacterium]